MSKELYEDLTILVVDDEPSITGLLKLTFNQAGFKVITASNGKEALSIFNKLEHNKTIVVTDIIMPDLDGIHLLKEIKKHAPEVPVIMVTGTATINNTIECIQSGADDFIVKPFTSIDSVIKKIESHAHKILNKILIQKNKDMFMHMLIHDLKNPLFGILGNIDLVLTFYADKLNEEIISTLKLSRHAADELLKMISDLLSINKFEGGNLETNFENVNIITLISDAISTMEYKARLENKSIVFKCKLKNCEAYLDKSLISRCILNLITNALKFTPANKSIQISLKKFKNYIVISVKDEGIGIPQKYIDKIFDKYTRIEAKKEGYSLNHGLGLTFCKIAISAHNGKIEVKSKPKKGAIFNIYLPLNPEESPFKS